MNTAEVLEGLNILQKYRTKPNGYHLGAEHDVLYAFATDLPVSEDDLKRLYELGWEQHEVKSNDDDTPGPYDPEEGWAAFV